MAPTTRSSKTNPKKKEHNKSPIKLDNEIPHLSPKTTLPTKLPVQHSTSKFDGMDLLMKAIEEHKILCQINKQKLDDFEMRCNSLSTTFAHYITDNNTNLQVLQDKMTKIEDYKDIQDIKLNSLEVKLQKIEKLQYNNPWLDQSNQHIAFHDNDNNVDDDNDDDNNNNDDDDNNDDVDDDNGDDDDSDKVCQTSCCLLDV